MRHGALYLQSVAVCLAACVGRMAPQSGTLKCSEEGLCPVGQSCRFDNYCHDDGEMLDAGTSAVSECGPGFTVEKHACVDIDECQTDNGGCDALVECTNVPGSFRCGNCAEGYTGGGPGGCVDINECATNNGGCDERATCTNTVGSRTCACLAGYMGNGLTCTPNPPTLTIANAIIDEPLNPTYMVFSILLSAASSQKVLVDYATTGVTAIAAADFTDALGTLTIQPGQVSATISVLILPDAIDEVNETFNLTLSNPRNVSFGAGTGTITTIGTIVSQTVCTHAGSAGSICRAKKGVCDVAETCVSGYSGCPADAKATAVCRASNGMLCDPAETCDGVNDSCPPDINVCQ
jgi:hypothetical protein